MGAERSEGRGGAGVDGREPEGARIDRLIEVLEAADEVFRSGSVDAREEVLGKGLAAIAALYGSIDEMASPVVAVHLEAAHDACLRALGDAYGGDYDALAAAVTMARAIRAALAPPAGTRTTKLSRAA